MIIRAQLNFADFRIVWKFANSAKNHPLLHKGIASRFLDIISSGTESNAGRTGQIPSSDHISNQFVSDFTIF